MNTSDSVLSTESPFHRGERFIQTKLGVRDKMERFGRQVIRNYMPEQHREFYAQLPFVFVGHADQQGWPWASILFKQPGFISSSDNRQLRINTLPVAGDPLATSLTLGNRLGLLGIELETRRRNRLSTYVSHVSETGFDLIVEQAFGNCPQYIQTRELQHIDPESMPAISRKSLKQLDSQAIELIKQSDTFFVASYIASGSQAVGEGADVSHRGGKPGFIRVDDLQTLTIPDYLGNFHFNTLGNLLENPKAGLLFIDFEQGHILTLTGSTQILWDSEDTKYFKGAERLWQFRVDYGYWLKNVLPLRWKLQEFSANTRLTGNWREVETSKKAEALKHSWQAYRITRIVKESSLVKSFYLQAPDGQTPQFLPGQFLTLKSTINDKEQIRTYTVSSAPNDEQLRVSVKLEGVFSSYLHQQLAEGEFIQAKAPTGEFTFDATEKNPVLLISAGIGITPMIAMVRHVLQEGIRTRSMVSISVICVARNDAQRAFFAELNALSESSGGHVRVFWILSQPETHLQQGIDYYHHGRLSMQVLQTILTEQNNKVYLCGPNSFMQSQYDHLRTLKINDADIFAEAFGPASLVRDQQKNTQLAIAEEAIITFTESQIEQAWSKKDGTLLELAEAHGLMPEFGCRSGQCGACKVKLLSGRTVYKHNINSVLNDDEVLICSAVPAAEDGIPQTRVTIQL